jgi:hypothetical protein
MANQKRSRARAAWAAGKVKDVRRATFTPAPTKRAVFSGKKVPLGPPMATKEFGTGRAVFKRKS